MSYAIYNRNTAVVVDGGAVDEILSFAAETNLEIKYVTHTHDHPDHTAGTAELVTRTGARRLNFEALNLWGEIPVSGETIKVYPTPGHTMDSVTFHFDNVLVTGDTLFNGTVGNCFSGDLERFYRSIKHLMGFPPETMIYAGHDYVEFAMAFARHIEPQNNAVDAFLAAYDRRHVFSLLRDETRINPYLRFNEPQLIEILKKRGLPVDTEYARWEGVMTLE